MPNVSRKALGEVIKRNLPSNKQHMVGSIMRKAGVDPKFSSSLKGYQAKAVMKKLQSQGILTSRAAHLTENEFGRQLQKADTPTGADPKILKARKIISQRERMLEEEKQKQKITEALTRKPGEQKAAAPSRAQAPAVGGGAIGQAARGASRPAGPGTGGFSGAGHVEPGRTPETPEKPDAPEAVDMFGED